MTCIIRGVELESMTVSPSLDSIFSREYVTVFAKTGLVRTRN